MRWHEGLSTLLIAITLVGVAVGRYPWLKMNRAAIALVGAILLVGLNALTLDEAYRAIDWNTILLLFAMMVLNVNLRISGFFPLVTGFVLRWARTPRRLLALLILTSGVCSAILLNDTIVLVFTPLVLDIVLSLKRNPLPYLIGLVAAANIGSVATITGNPQNMLVGLSSGISYVDFTLTLAPVAMLGLGLIWLVVVRVYRTEFAAGPLADVRASLPAPDARHLRKTLIATGLMLVALVAGAPVPFAAALAAALLLVSQRQDPETIFREIDWSLLVFFCGLFVVTGAIAHSNLGPRLFAGLHAAADHGPAALTGVALVLSNLVSNVPAVMLFRPVVPMLAHPPTAWLTLAMATTLAGNLTLLGSMANLIVAEIARRRGVQLTFTEYLKAGTPIALLSLALGIGWMLCIG